MYAFPDAIAAAYSRDDGGNHWFRIALHDGPPADAFGCNVVIDVDGSQVGRGVGGEAVAALGVLLEQLVHPLHEALGHVGRQVDAGSVLEVRALDLLEIGPAEGQLAAH